MTESATLDFPPIVEPAQEPAQTAIAVAPKSVVTIKEAAVAHLRSHEATILALAERYRDVALPLDTPKGLAAGQAALTEVRENGRFAVQRARDATKDLLNGAKKDVEAEATRLIALIQPTEAHIEAQITARKAVLAAEKAEKERIEAERVARHRANIERIRGYVAQAQGQPSDKIAGAIAFVRGLTFGPEYEEFCDEAANARDEVLLALSELYATTKAREEEAARLEAQRVEQARIAAEQAETQRKLDEQAAEFQRRLVEIDRAEREAQAKRDAEAEAARIAALPVAVSVSSVDDNTGSRSPAVESEQQADPTESLPVAAARSLDLPEAAEHIASQPTFSTSTPVTRLPLQFDLVAHLRRQAAFSARTFGPGPRVEGVTDHIAKELIEVRDSGGALAEWVDVVILGLDGAWRSGATPEQIAAAIEAKQTKNEGRTWPDWRTADPGKAIEHVRDIVS